MEASRSHPAFRRRREIEGARSHAPWGATGDYVGRCTRIAGLGEVLPVHDQPEQLAASVLRLLQDDEEWMQVSERGCAYISRHFSRDALNKAIAAALNHEPGAPG